jgi:hypothetical protein
MSIGAVLFYLQQTGVLRLNTWLARLQTLVPVPRPPPRPAAR